MDTFTTIIIIICFILQFLALFYHFKNQKLEQQWNSDINNIIAGKLPEKETDNKTLE